MELQEDGLICPYCQHEISDVHNGGDPGPWWNGEDSEIEHECESCSRSFLVKSEWSPKFESHSLP